MASSSDSDLDTDEAFYDAQSSLGSAPPSAHSATNRSFFRDSIDSQKLTSVGPRGRIDSNELDTSELSNITPPTSLDGVQGARALAPSPLRTSSSDAATGKTGTTGGAGATTPGASVNENASGARGNLQVDIDTRVVHREVGAGPFPITPTHTQSTAHTGEDAPALSTPGVAGPSTAAENSAQQQQQGNTVAVTQESLAQASAQDAVATTAPVAGTTSSSGSALSGRPPHPPSATTEPSPAEPVLAPTTRPVGGARHRRTASAVSDVSEAPSHAVMTDPVTDITDTDLPSDIDDDDEMFQVKNLDTGDVLTLTQAAALFPDADPLSKHMAEQGMAVFDHSSGGQQDDAQSGAAQARAAPQDSQGASGQGKRGFFSRLRKKKRTPSTSDMSRPANYVKVWTHHKNDREYSHMTHVQGIAQHSGPIWALAFSLDATYLATGGRDTHVKVFKVIGGDGIDTLELIDPTPVHVFKGHRADVLDIQWSKNFFILSASMDKTVRLWHPDHPKILGNFQHKEFVTSIQFHPLEDQLFLSGSLDKHIRIWNIPDGQVVSVVEAIGFITAVTFTPDGSHVLAGSHSGTCTFYETKGLKHAGHIDVRSKRGKNAVGRKISGIVCSTTNHALITTNDSRIRLYDLNTRKQVAKYKGLRNNESQIRASFEYVPPVPSLSC
eukprot:TRINITY_DN5224_c0_g2_i1.p1 TRINITY_DN5224_c0_g2~~TRINITY_DN5224_c0_g2_i1.p1  ORF type:complete len:668 (+),score=87.09 TRINITY_DN5224_c0_g2_i1:476-2479(+)